MGLTAFHKFEDTKAAMEVHARCLLFFLRDDLFYLGGGKVLGKDVFF